MIYLDNAATSYFKPKCVLKAVTDEISHPSNPGRSAHSGAVKSAIYIHNTRQTVSDFFGCAESNVVFTKNCTEALNLAIFSLTGGHIITTVYEHNSVLRPLRLLESKGLITLTIVSPNGVNDNILTEDIEKAIKPDTKMIVTSHVSNVTGNIMDIAAVGKLARNRNILYLVDAAQSAGHVQINMKNQNIDMLAAPGHKGLHGIQGSGFLCYNERVKLKPLIFGGTGTSSDSPVQPDKGVESFESGTLNTPAIRALNEGIKWTKDNFNAIKFKSTMLTLELIYGLRAIPHVKLYSNPSSLGVVSFNINGLSCTDAADYYNECCVAVRSGIHCAPLIHKYLKSDGAIRASIGWNNSEKDIRTFLRVTEELSEKASRFKI